MSLRIFAFNGVILVFFQCLVKKVYQYCPYTGEFIKEWNSVKEVFLELNINAASIAHCCRLKSKSAGKFIWRYTKKEKIEIMSNVKLKIKKIC